MTKQNDSHHNNETDTEDNTGEGSGLNFWQVLISVVAAAFGVQSEQNRQRDFSSKTGILPYIFAGLLFTVIFVITLVLIVKWVLP